MNPPSDGKLSFIFGRRSIRAYQPAPVSDELVTDLLRAAMAAPSACAKDPWRFVVVRNRATLNSIAEALPNAKMLAQAPCETGLIQTFARACSRSAIKSSTSSKPRASRTRLSTMPMDSRYATG